MGQRFVGFSGAVQGHFQGFSVILDDMLVKLRELQPHLSIAHFLRELFELQQGLVFVASGLRNPLRTTLARRGPRQAPSRVRRRLRLYRRLYRAESCAPETASHVRRVNQVVRRKDPPTRAYSTRQSRCVQPRYVTLFRRRCAGNGRILGQSRRRQYPDRAQGQAPRSPGV